MSLWAALLAPSLVLAQEVARPAPFVTTPPGVVARMLELAGTGAQDTVVDLGSGDGRIVIHAARVHGARGLGVDLDPALVARARENAERAGVAGHVRFEVGDALRTDLSAASVVTVYLLPFLHARLTPRLLAQLRPGARIVTHAFPLQSWPPDRTDTVGESSRLFLYVVPAQARGTWQAAGGWRLSIEQNYQEIDVALERDGRALRIDRARLEGERIRFSGPEVSFEGRVSGDRIVGDGLLFERR